LVPGVSPGAANKRRDLAKVKLASTPEPGIS
jgi:hypothetical protein